MKPGQIIAIDSIERRLAAALLKDGQLEDLVIDPPEDTLKPGAIYWAKASRPIKGQNGLIVELGDTRKGFLKHAKGIAPGTVFPVQVNTYAETGKAAPVTRKLIFKSRYAIVTPEAPGVNIARAIQNAKTRTALQDLAAEAFSNAPEGCGLILRTACAGAEDQAIRTDISTVLKAAVAVLNHQSNTPELLLEAPRPVEYAWIEWAGVDEIVETPGCFETLGILDHINALMTAVCPLSDGASMILEPTRAFVAVDVNTGKDFSFAAGLKANLAAAKGLPHQLRLRGLGGQIVMDFAPCPKKDRIKIETELRRALKNDPVNTSLVGWTPLGHYEMQRKRERYPLSKVLSDGLPDL